MSKLHFTLRQLAGYIRIPGDRKYKFRQRAEAILTRWEALFLADISRPDSTLFWAIKGARAIVFIPRDHREYNASGSCLSFFVLYNSLFIPFLFIQAALRTSDNALDLVYGLKGDGSFEGRFFQYERL